MRVSSKMSVKVRVSENQKILIYYNRNGKRRHLSEDLLLIIAKKLSIKSNINYKVIISRMAKDLSSIVYIKRDG